MIDHDIAGDRQDGRESWIEPEVIRLNLNEAQGATGPFIDGATASLPPP
ncbi:hypothetical protein [uncultured Tistrella sp.]|nr:hypothetical protein [uncultured Tistrella sp.]